MPFMFKLLGGDSIGTMLPGAIDKEILVETAPRSTAVVTTVTETPGIGNSHSDIVVPVVIGVIVTVVSLALIAAVSVVVIVCVVVRSRIKIFKMRQIAR